MLTLSRAAATARVRYQYALDLVLRGEWRGLQAGRRWLVEAESVRRWVADHCDTNGGHEEE